jgi:26S proteasome regulatory subunit T6
MESVESPGLKHYYVSKIEELNQKIMEKTHTIRRLETQRNELNTTGN